MALCVLAVLLPGTGRCEDDPTATVRAASDAMLERLSEDADIIRADRSHVLELIDELVMPHIDTHRMALLVLGEHWQAASAEQRERFTDELVTYVARFYARVFCEVAGEPIDVRFLPPETAPDGRLVSIRSEIRQSVGECARVEYRMYETETGWRVIDFVIDGVSLVQSNRSQYDPLIRRDGLDAVIDRMAARNARPFR